MLIQVRIRNVRLALANLCCLQQICQPRLKKIVREKKANTYNTFNADVTIDKKNGYDILARSWIGQYFNSSEAICLHLNYVITEKVISNNDCIYYFKYDGFHCSYIQYIWQQNIVFHEIQQVIGTIQDVLTYYSSIVRIIKYRDTDCYTIFSYYNHWSVV